MIKVLWIRSLREHIPTLKVRAKWTHGIVVVSDGQLQVSSWPLCLLE